MLEFVIAFLLGICSLQFFPDLSLINYIYFITVIIGVVVYFCPIVKDKKKFKYIFVFFLGCCYVFYFANLQVEHSYPFEQQKKTIVVSGKVTSLPDYKNNKVTFEFLIKDIVKPENH